MRRGRGLQVGVKRTMEMGESVLLKGGEWSLATDSAPEEPRRDLF